VAIALKNTRVLIERKTGIGGRLKQDMPRGVGFEGDAKIISWEVPAEGTGGIGCQDPVPEVFTRDNKGGRYSTMPNTEVRMTPPVDLNHGASIGGSGKIEVHARQPRRGEL